MIHANKPFQVVKMIQIDPEWSLRRRLRRLGVRCVSRQIIVKAKNADNAPVAAIAVQTRSLVLRLLGLSAVIAV